MAVVKKKQARKIRFELTLSAIAGIAVIVFCLFLWMFLLGVWAGQSILLPDYGQKNVVIDEKGKIHEPPTIRVEKKSVKKSD